MHPHLPRPLTAWLLAVAVFGSFSAQTQAAESISINFGSGQASISDGNTVGIEAVAGSNWNQFSDASQSSAQTLKNNDGNTTSASATWSSKLIYQAGNTSTGTGEMLYGYLDDGSGVSINVNNLDFLTYDVYIYCNTDTPSANFSSKTVNGISYTWDSETSSTVQGTTQWGTQGTYDSLEKGVNTLYVADQTESNLIISSSRVGGTIYRGCISGIQVVNTYTGTKKEATLSGNADWTSSQLGTAAWTDSTTEAGTYASVSGTGTLTIAEGETRTTDAVVLTGGNLEITGGSLNLIGVGKLRALEGATLTVSSALSGIADVDGLGSVIMKGTQTLSGLRGTGSLTLSSDAAISLTGDTDTAYTGTLVLEKGASINAGDHWSFTGQLTMDVTQYSGASSWAGSAKELTLTGEGTTTFTGTGNLNGKTLNITDGVTAEVSIASGLAAGVLQNTTVNVLAGGTFKASGHDSLGWGGGHTDKIVLTGEDGKYATFLNNEDGAGSNTLVTDIVMNGHAKVTGTKINTFGGTITASNTDNVFDSELQIRNNVTITVNKDGELTLAGKLNNDQSSSGTNRITKAGAGTLIVSSTDYSDYNAASGGWNINAGTLKVAQNAGVGVVGVTVASGATLDVASGGHVGNALNLSAGSTLKLTTGGLVLDNGSLTLGTGLTLNISTGDEMLLSALGLDDSYSYTLASGVSSITSGDWTEKVLASDYFSAITVNNEALSLDNAWLYYDSTAQTLTLASVPEPTTATLSLLALGALALRRRRA